MSKSQPRIFSVILFPSIFLLILWAVKLFEWVTKQDLIILGIFPLKIEGLIGIFTSALIHSDFHHLISNSFPMFFLLLGLFFFYASQSYKIFLMIYLLEGAGVWLGGREAYHIGCSGLVYGLASFIFFSGVFRKNKQLAAISMLVVFLYGSMIWGIFPQQPNISWESHFLGFVAGLLIAIYYRNVGRITPPKIEQIIESEYFSQISATSDFKKINYIFKD